MSEWPCRGENNVYALNRQLLLLHVPSAVMRVPTHCQCVSMNRRIIYNGTLLE